MADGINVANAYVQIMPSMEGATSSITDAILPAMQGAGDQAGAAMGGGILSRLQSLGGPLVAVGSTLVGALGAAKVGEALLGIGGEFDAMRDAIIVGTGASGEALEALEESAKGIATTVGGSFVDAGDIVQDLNTRLGLVGDDLDAVGQRVAAAGQIMGSAIDVESMSGAFAAWGVEASDMAGEMDYLFGVAQSTGIGFDELTGIIERNAPALQGLGLTFEESANMAGLLDRAGMDASGMMGRMGKALVELTQPGESAAEAYQRVLSEMQGYIEVGDEAAAMDLATQLFGTRGASQFVAAVQSGALSMDQLADAALGAGDGIMGTFEATASWPERLEQIKNKAAAALEPLGGALMEGVGAALDKVSEAMDQIDPQVLEDLGTAIGDGLVGAVDLLGGALDILLEHSDDIAAFFGYVAVGAQTVMAAIEPLATFLGDTFAGVVVPAVEAALDLLGGDFQGARDKIGQAFDGVRAIIEGARVAISSKFDAIKTAVSDKVGAIKKVVTDKFAEIKKAITQPIEDAKGAVSSAIQSIKDAFNVTLSFPHIKLPHFRINGGEVPWGIGGKGHAPSIGIDWYAEGGVVDGARLIGVGERGPELVWPAYDPYMGRYAEAIAEHMPDQGELVDEVRALREDVKNIKVYLDTGALVGGIGRQMDGALGRRQQYAGRGL